MNIDKWLEEQLKKIQETDKDELLETMKSYGLVDVTPNLYFSSDELCEMTEEDLQKAFEKIREVARNNVVVIGVGQSRYTPNLSNLEVRAQTVLGTFGLPSKHLPYDYQTWDADMFKAQPGEEIGHISTNSRKKVVVSNSGFPYPVPTKSKKRK